MVGGFLWAPMSAVTVAGKRLAVPWWYQSFFSLQKQKNGLFVTTLGITM
jgi:hypothetical protein